MAGRVLVLSWLNVLSCLLVFCGSVWVQCSTMFAGVMKLSRAKEATADVCCVHRETERYVAHSSPAIRYTCL